MKKIILMVAFVFAATMSISTHAAVYYPESVSFDNSNTTVLEGASSASISIMLSKNMLVGDNLIHNIGVSREIKKGNITQFQVLSSNLTSSSELEKNNWTYNLAVPNPLDNPAGSTYVVYVKTYLANDPDSENLIISRPFSIKTSNKPYGELTGVSLLLSNGTEFGSKSGPTIYENPKSTNFATSVKLTLDINLNTALTLNPEITFTRLRSDSFNESFTPAPITLAVGKNRKLIELPTFDYEPGVYIGTITLNPDKEVGLIEQIEFQYIVDGPMVTVGRMSYISHLDDEYKFVLPTFGRPVDYLTPEQEDLTVTASTTQEYKTVLAFMDKGGKEIVSVPAVIDYNQLSYNFSVINENIKHAVKVNIKAYDGDKVFFETTQDLDLPTPAKSNVLLVYAWVILLLGIAWYLISRKKLILVLTIILSLIFVATFSFAVEWTPTPTVSKFWSGHNGNHYATVTFNKNFSTEPVSCSTEGTDVLIKLTMSTCSNSHDQVYVGSSRVSMATASSSAVLVSDHPEPEEDTHVNIIYTLDYIKIDNIKGPVAPNSFLYLHVKLNILQVKECRTRFSDYCTGYAQYVIPLVPTPTSGLGACDRCTNIPGDQVTANFQAHSRDYFFVASEGLEGTLRFAAPAAGSGQASTPTICEIDMCANTDAVEDPERPAGQEWNLSAGTDYEKYSCSTAPEETCSCNGTRTRTCVSGGVVTSTTPNASQCALQTSCTYNVVGNQATFTFSATGAIGSVSYAVGSNPVTRTIPSGGSVTETRTATDAYDGATATASCTATGGTLVPPNLEASCVATKNAEQTEATFTYSTNNSSGTVTYSGYNGDNPITVPLPADGSTVTVNRNVSDNDETVTATCSAENTNPTEDQDSEIISFTSSAVVDRGDSCVFNWTTQDMASCTLGGVAVGVLNGSQTFPTTAGLNITKTLTCIADDPAPASSQSLTKTCLVRPRVNEN